MPRFNVEFYKPRISQPQGTPFPDILSNLVQRPIAERIRRGDDPAIILTINQRHQQTFGEAARIAMDNLPSVINLANGGRHDLNVEETEGLGAEINFLYDEALDVIAVESRGQFRPPSLERLLGDLTNTVVDFQIILTRDAWERFDRMNLIKKIEFKVARPRNVQGRPMPALLNVFNDIDEFGGVDAKMVISVGRSRRRGLAREAVRGILAALRHNDAAFESLSVTGATVNQANDRHGPPQIVDFIEGPLLYSEEVDRRGRRRRPDPEGCRLVLGRAIRQHTAYLRTLR